ncbi:MAG: S-methyl-5'-thioadenosine phosphorylase [Candidatus Omnitrophica bacterium]|nr:S-methyl-5'-thioadenosine phosphorylase [Candidatus Omnitrophota bacterium]
MVKIAIIGGSGLYDIKGLKNTRRISFNTPFGKPSDKIVVGELEGKRIAFLPRHGKGHYINPSQINYRANIYALKKLGVERIISVSACGSLRESIMPQDFVIPFQFVDRTNQARKMTFFENGMVVHISFADPICMELAETLATAIRKLNIRLHTGAVYVNMEGPAFSTRAESELYRRWGMDIIGMTNMAEAKLAREAEICYVTLAAVTDYDCWYKPAEPVTAQMVMENLRKNTENAKLIIKEVLPHIREERNCFCKDALRYAIVTPARFIPRRTKKILYPIIGRYIDE